MHRLDRRSFTKVVALGLAGAAVPALGAQTSRKLKVGHTGITWGFSPADAERAIADVASLGFHGYESFGNVLEAWEAKGGLDKLLDAAKLPLRSAYCPVNLTDPARRKDEVAKIVRWGELIKKCGGSVAVIGPNNVKRAEYTFADHKSNIVDALNEIGKALTGIGVIGALHQHTDTCVETREETYAVMEAVDTRYVKFGPDVGQLQKGGSDPVKVVKDFLSVIRHVHMKDFDGGANYLGYCPLGQGKVDVSAVCDLLDNSGNDLMIMAELDPSKGMPLAPLEAARINKLTLQKLGYAFRQASG
ncbi:MAG TPA: sugar phosphate isomerase/epimerase [Vicinamibacterales bacterium]|jgi:inosose dehydratase